MNGPSSRMVRLLSLLQTGRSWPAGELADRLGTTPRTLRRDLERLRELGYPVVSVRGPAGGYRLVAGRAMPPLVFTDDEAIATVAGLRVVAPASAAADGALAKLERVLPPRLRERVPAMAAVTHTGSWRAPDLAVVDALAMAAHTRHEVRFTYRDREGVVSERHVAPYRQVLLDRYWYLLAWDFGRVDWRTFRVDRIASVARSAATFVSMEPPPDTMVHPSVAGPAAVVRFDAPVSAVSPRLRAAAGSLEADGAVRCRYTSPPDDWAWLAGVVAAVGVPYRVESPPELVAETVLLAERAGRAVS